MSNVGRHADAKLIMLHETLLPAPAIFAFCHRRGDFRNGLFSEKLRRYPRLEVE